MEVKQINKRASGQAFELILKPPSPISEAPRTLASPKKKDLSLEDHSFSTLVAAEKPIPNMEQTKENREAVPEKERRATEGRGNCRWNCLAEARQGGAPLPLGTPLPIS